MNPNFTGNPQAAAAGVAAAGAAIAAAPVAVAVAAGAALAGALYLIYKSNKEEKN
ncbi:MAG: hypothetical protein J6P74_07905 [Paludibacteraceae bacterium]|nr:hypothetical protein [Paludibacteraceae bacterium]